MIQTRLDKALLRVARGLKIARQDETKLIAGGYATRISGQLTLTPQGRRAAEDVADTGAGDQCPRHEHLGRLLRWFRQRAHKPLAAILKDTGLSRSTLYAYEAGERMPGALTLLDLCMALGANPTDIAVLLADDPKDPRIPELVIKGLPVGPNVRKRFLERGWVLKTAWGALMLTEAGVMEFLAPAVIRAGTELADDNRLTA